MVAASRTGDQFNDVWVPYLAIAGGVWLIVFFAVVLFIWRYRVRRDPDRKPGQKVENHLLEGSYVTLLVLVVAFLVAFTYLHENQEDDFAGSHHTFQSDTASNGDLTSAPAVSVDVIGARWNWRFHYQGTDVTQVPPSLHKPTELYVPANRTIHFAGRSQDVVHDFWVPDVRYQRQIWPQHVETWNLTFPPGRHFGKCAWFCGLYHESMEFVVIAVPPARFAAWLQERKAQEAGT